MRPQRYPELPRLALKSVTKTFPNLFHHFGDFHIKTRYGPRDTDRQTDTPSYRDARTYLKIAFLLFTESYTILTKFPMTKRIEI